MTTQLELARSLDFKIPHDITDGEQEKMASFRHGAIGTLLSSYLVQYVYPR